MEPESRFTPARPDCPHPEWWHAEDAWSSELEVGELVYGFVRALQPEVVVETGTWYGATAELIGRALRANGHGTLYSLEIDPAKIEAARERVRDLPVELVHTRSLDWTPPGEVGFAWLDSDQSARVDEVELLRTHFARGAVFGIHDTGPHHTVVHHLHRLHGVRLLSLRTPRGVVFGQMDY